MNHRNNAPQLCCGEYVTYYRDHSINSIEIFSFDVDSSRSTFEIPRVDLRRSFNTAIPVRIGLNSGLSYATNSEKYSYSSRPSSAYKFDSFGLSNLGLTLEAAFVNKPDFALTAYINQHFDTVDNSMRLQNTLRPVSGANSYGFQTGLELSKHLYKGLSSYSNLGYRFDRSPYGYFADASYNHSFVYWNELVLECSRRVNPSLGLLGMTQFGEFDGYTDLRIVPGIIAAFGNGNNLQFRLSAPIGLSDSSPDFGIQFGLLMLR